ncbi:uncharacterized protein LOC110643219 [Hevea brasiliensis]|uniref:uncharacterized protein LOC110643219 n=1 Tax=Hevea brasiliensis TaxID=3981 RepID=UPI0025D7124B|nr:uncharacterized protein LOC110643219 [Hevea brasiliensis]
MSADKVQVDALLNELTYLKYEASKNTSTIAVSVLVKQQNVAIAFSMVERIIKLTSAMAGNEEELIGENTFIKVINGLNETINVLLEYLKDVKEHGQNKGNDLLASVGVVGSYLAETPDACKDKVRELLVYMLSIEADDESRFGNFNIVFVVECLIIVIRPCCYTVEDDSSIFLACNTIMNLLLKKEQVQFPVDESTAADLLMALGYWAEDANDPSVLMMASSICAFLFDYTSEEALLYHSNFERSSLCHLSQLIARSLAFSKQMEDLNFWLTLRVVNMRLARRIRLIASEAGFSWFELGVCLLFDLEANISLYALWDFQATSKSRE